MIKNSGITHIKHALEKLLRMEYKQLFITLDQSLLEEIKERSAAVEKRSLNSLARKIFADLPDDRELLIELGKYLKAKEIKSAASKDTVGLTLRITEDELWDLKEKAVKARMNPREFTVYLLELWNSGELKPGLQMLEEQYAERKAS